MQSTIETVLGQMTLRDLVTSEANMSDVIARRVSSAMVEVPEQNFEEAAVTH
jgi:hypothetical protein